MNPEYFFRAGKLGSSQRTSRQPSLSQTVAGGSAFEYHSPSPTRNRMLMFLPSRSAVWRTSVYSGRHRLLLACGGRSNPFSISSIHKIAGAIASIWLERLAEVFSPTGRQAVIEYSGSRRYRGLSPRRRHRLGTQAFAGACTPAESARLAAE